MGSFFDDPIPRNLSSEDISRRRALYVRELQDLKNEIGQMEEQLQQARVAQGSADIISYLTNLADKKVQNSIRDTTVKSVPTSEIERTRANLEALSEIVFTEVGNELMMDGVTRTYKLRGSCSGIEFQLQFDVDDHTLVLSSLNINVQSEYERPLQPLVARGSRDRSLRNFFKYFVQFAQLSTERAQVFRQLKEEHSAQIILPQGRHSSHLFFTSAATGCGFVLTWSLFFDNAGQLTQQTGVAPKATNRLILSDKHKLLQSLPERFEQLVSVKGLVAAVNILIRLFTKKLQ